MKRFDYYQPQSLKEAFDLMEKLQGRARWVAGGTDLIVRIKQKAVAPEALISLRSIDELRGFGSGGGLSMGSMVILRDIERDQNIMNRYPVLTSAVSWLANPQVRNVATVGGNLCNAAPSADCAPPLLVLAATLVLDGPGGKREVPIEDFFTGPGLTCMETIEILTEIKIPDLAPSTGMAFQKTGRVAKDIAVANAAVLVTMDGKKCRTCRIAAGAVAPKPLRLHNVEKMVEGEKITPELLEQVAAMVEKEVSPITDVRSTEEYRRTVTGVLVRRAMTEALESIQ